MPAGRIYWIFPWLISPLDLSMHFTHYVPCTSFSLATSSLPAPFSSNDSPPLPSVLSGHSQGSAGAPDHGGT